MYMYIYVYVYICWFSNTIVSIKCVDCVMSYPSIDNILTMHDDYIIINIHVTFQLILQTYICTCIIVL